ncbi:TetR family transcriptional regulator [Novosphingobium sp. FSY-8]|uniref:TetR family transcriptional regulator n=1 Tax=Novosphingobium ovatum TaxID=1908523 RepID=A0ABW9XEL0_9SPHN|nr:TetR/AcrR family transcriptional regulator [Novosphingobium ovatum]NBC36974.1 TetR family transcriptional regulator [Novosphingobium ovatum]
MRVKCDSRRRCILDAAIQLFRDIGFDRVSMAQISARAGGSKATLYSYFASKEELFAEAMVDAMQEEGHKMLGLLDPDEADVPLVLGRFARAYLHFLSRPEGLNCVRTCIANGGEGELGKALYRLGPQKGWREVAQYIAQVMARGLLRQTEAMPAALQLRGMLEAGYIQPLLYGAEPELPLEEAAERAVDTFLRAYAVQQ